VKFYLLQQKIQKFWYDYKFMFINKVREYFLFTCTRTIKDGEGNLKRAH